MLSEYDILIIPFITEKTSVMNKLHKVCFKVHKQANKDIIKKAVQKVYNVNVKSINIINIRGKKKIFKGVAGCRSSFKKAFITVCSNKKINLFKVTE